MTKEKKKEYLIISLLPFIMLVYSIIFTNPADLIKGMKDIFLSDGVLLTDYFVVGGKGAAMFSCTAEYLSYLQDGYENQWSSYIWNLYNAWLCLHGKKSA